MAKERHINDDSAPRKASGCWGSAIFVAVVFVIMTLAASVMFSGWQSRSRETALRRLAEIRAAGEPTSGVELNAYYDQLTSDGPDVTSNWLDVIELVQRQAFVDDTTTLDFQPFGNTPLPLVDEEWPEQHKAIDFLERNSDILDAIHAAASREGECRYPVDFRDLLLARLDHLDPLRQATRLLLLEATIHARSGDARSYVDTIEATLVAGNSAEFEPTLVSMLVRLAIHGSAWENIRSVLTRVEISRDESQRLRRILLEQDYMRQMRFAFSGERAFGADVILTGQHLEQVPLRGLPIRFSELNNYLGWMDRVISAANMDFSDGARAIGAIDTEYQAFISNMPALKVPLNALTNLLLPAVTSPHNAAGRSMTLSRACATALAIEEYRQTRNVLPASLDELVPDYLQEVAQDPYANGPLRYKIRDDGYVIYSIGPNLADDGGAVAPGWNAPDIAFAVPSEPPEDEED